MGVDVYMRWQGQTAEEHERQFQSGLGADGYIRESYFSGALATFVLFEEAWSQWDGHLEYDDDGRISDPLPPLPNGCESVRVMVPSTAWAMANMKAEEAYPSVAIRYPVELLQARMDAAAVAAEQRYEDNPERAEEHIRDLEGFVETYATLTRMGKEPSVYVSY